MKEIQGKFIGIDLGKRTMEVQDGYRRKGASSKKADGKGYHCHGSIPIGIYSRGDNQEADRGKSACFESAWVGNNLSYNKENGPSGCK